MSSDCFWGFFVHSLQIFKKSMVSDYRLTFIINNYI